jgi:hypothetical protein
MCNRLFLVIFNSALWFGVLPVSASDEMVCIADHVSSTNGHLEYLVPKTRLLVTTNQWSPASNPFPVNIRQYAEKARDHLRILKGIRTPLRVIDIRIEPVGHSFQEAGTHHSNSALPWKIEFAFGFDDKNGELVRRHDLAVVMLLDGTIAEQKTASQD